MRIYGLIGFTLLLALVLPAPVVRQAQPAGPSGLYIALGDSIAAGTGSSLPRERGYPAILRSWMKDLNDAAVPMVNLARPGETAATFVSDDQVDELRAEVDLARDAGLPLTAVTVSLGGNEILQVADSGISDRGVALDEFRTNLESAIAKVRSTVGPDVPIALTNYYDPTNGDAAIQFSDSWWIAQFNTVIAEVAGAHGCLVADVAATFAGNIDEFTLHPADVHPTNQGYLAIARQVWTSLNFDGEAPDVQVRAPDQATRTTPTLQFNVSDNVGVADIVVYIGDEMTFEPVELLNGGWVALLDLSGIEGETVEVGIVASDDAGNVTTVTHTIALAIG